MSTLFIQSTLAVSAAIAQVADAAGSSAEPEQTTRAGRSLNAGIEYLNARANWNFTLTESPLTVIVAPFTVVGITASAGSTSALAPTAHGIANDDIVAFNGLLAGSRITATGSASIGFNGAVQTAIGTGNQVVQAQISRDTYDLPSDFKMLYTIRLYAQQSTLRPIGRRQYDRGILDEFTTTTPRWYDVFGVGVKGRIRILPPPGTADSMGIKYYRRISVPTATAATENLEVPQDYEPYLLAWAKWHYLTDKSEGRSEQAATWLSFANEGLKVMLADQTRLPDEDLMFIPGHYQYNPSWGPNAVRPYLDEAW